MFVEEILMEELLDAIKSTKTNSAGGPSGLTYDILRDVEEEHLGPLLATLQQCLATGKVPAEMNRSKLKPIPKTDKGLSDLGKTRPIALMEVTLKLYEKILFKRRERERERESVIHLYKLTAKLTRK